MKLLLYTHIWLGYVLGDPRLSLQLQRAITDPNTELLLSPTSILGDTHPCRKSTDIFTARSGYMG